MHKIYFDTKPLYLSSEIDEELKSLMNQPQTLYVANITESSVNKIIRTIEGENVKRAIVVHSDVAELFSLFKNEFIVLQAGGGLVRSDNGSVLLIFRKGKWDMPKGKLDEGEGIEDCALREVKEETGLKEVTLGQKIMTTYHTYHEKGKPILKESHWYRMQTNSTDPLTPQVEEDIARCEWVCTKDIKKYTMNMHTSIIDVLQADGLLSQL